MSVGAPALADLWQDHRRRWQALRTGYDLGDVIGTGGMGVVFRGVQRALTRPVAIKMPLPGLVIHPYVERRFRCEALAGSRLKHKHLVSVFDYGHLDDAPYLVMECANGSLLGVLAREAGPLALSTTGLLVTQVLAGLAEAHDAGIVHGDVKSDNVLVEGAGAGVHARLIDFGLARLPDDPFVAAPDNTVSGTPEYMAPELLDGGPPTVASDLYAIGILLYELLTGTTPFGGGTTKQIFARHVHDAVEPPSVRSPERGIPSAIDEVVMTALAKDPAERFACARTCAAALEAALVAPPSTRTRAAPTIAVDERDEVRAARAGVGDALRAGHADDVVAAYLELARLLIEDSRLATAASELEHALTLLTPQAGETPPGALWRIELTLAALYSGLGDAKRARVAARSSYDFAHQVRSTVGVKRARTLLARLSRGCAPERPSIHGRTR